QAIGEVIVVAHQNDRLPEECREKRISSVPSDVESGNHWQTLAEKLSRIHADRSRPGDIRITYHERASGDARCFESAAQESIAHLDVASAVRGGHRSRDNDSCDPFQSFYSTY